MTHFDHAKTRHYGRVLRGRSGETRTRGLMVPNHARYQLRYTSISEDGLCSPFPFWSGKRESNPQPSAGEATALPLSHFRILSTRIISQSRNDSSTYLQSYKTELFIILRSYCIISLFMRFVKLFCGYFKISFCRAVSKPQSINLPSKCLPLRYAFSTSA